MKINLEIEGITQECEVHDLRGFINDLLNKLQEETKVITEIIVNDEEKYTDLSGIFELDPENINKLSVQTASYHRLCINTLTEMLEYLSRLDEGYETIGELVENDRISEAMTILNSAVEGIEWMNTAFSKIINIMKIELTEDENTFIREYGQHLNELMQALENQDFVTVKDIVLYELKDDVASWKKLLEKYKREGEKIH